MNGGMHLSFDRVAKFTACIIENIYGMLKRDVELPRNWDVELTWMSIMLINVLDVRSNKNLKLVHVYITEALNTMG